ncbi:hypothetical protein OEB99_16590 [Actinotalea sp. M2MS4P-6]|uniref:hypothetical protein n=1 Tax=Actinotalea sp. M2MS4P-6 TaxID=2983762 RepID=UPI0021E37263|nr:hypothetical protein [Actinotalea sp. M2MS4P-6]MCV2395935.1 hypothetical protein [Actinotalea sp. M2MS4P-6]
MTRVGEAVGLRPTAIVEQAVARANAAESLLEVLTESLADLELQLDDTGWDRIIAGSREQFSRAGLTRSAEACRVMAVAHPLVKRGVNLRIAYVWGSGVQITARAGADETQDVNAVVQAFLDDDGNQGAYTGDQAHERLERSVATDGNVFIAHFTNPRTGFVQARRIPFAEIADPITNPDDASEAWYYRREWSATVVRNDGTTATQMLQAYYPALGYWPATRPKQLNGAPVMWDAPVLHVKVNDLDGWDFGIGDVYAALPWARLYRDFLADWATLVKSLSQYAWRATSKGSKAQALRQKLTRRPAETAPDGNPNNVGATAVMGNDVTLEAIPKTGATVDSDSGRPLAAMIAAGLGIAVTVLLADPGQTGARAVAETLDRPTELEMGMRRSVWEDAYRRSLAYVITAAVRAPQGPLSGTVLRDTDTGRMVTTLTGDVDQTVEFDWPSMDDLPVDQFVKAIVEADGTSKIPPEVTARLLMQVLGVKDVDDILESMLDDQGNWVDPMLSAGQAAIDAFRRGEDPAQVL